MALALRQRQQWLVEQELADRPDLLETLRRRELMRIVARLSRETGLAHAEVHPELRIEGKYTGSVMVGTARMGVIKNDREFSLVPWRPVLERARGREVSGIMREGRGGISWTIGRDRGLER